MAATVTSAWSKPGAWALDSEEHEEELKQQPPQPQTVVGAPPSDFPDLVTAANTKTKKKKGQTLSLNEFVSGSNNNKTGGNYHQANKGLTAEDMMMLPTGPRQRSAEEMDRTRLGNGFRSYSGGDRGESGSSRWGPGRGSEDGRKVREPREPLGPSRADEIHDWGANKKSSVGGGFERRERDRGGFFEGSSHSRADDVDRWASSKPAFTPSEGRRGSGFDRERRSGMGFESSGEADTAENWGRKKEVEWRKFGGAFDSLRDRRSGGESSDGDTWGRKREEVVSLGSGSVSRPKLNLQPRKLPVVGDVETVKVSKGSNPFGDARPREEVLKEKGEDWKEMDEKLEAMKIKDLGASDRMKRGVGRPRSNEDSNEGTWRKNQSVDGDVVAPPSGDNNENGHTEEQPQPEEEDAQK